MVDDDSNNLSCMGTFLRCNGFEPLLASSGEEALETVFVHERVDLVLMDVRMPGMGGLEALRRLRTSGSEVPVILMSAYETPGEMEGASFFLEKPIEPDNLVGAISRGLKAGA